MTRAPAATLAFVGLVVTGATAAVPAPVAAARERVAVSLEPVARPAAPQGVPFRFRATVHNRGGAPATAELSFRVSAPGRAAVPFTREVVIVPGGTDVGVRGTVTPSQWFARRGRFRIVALRNGRRAAALGFRVTRPPLRVPRFADVTGTAGLATSVPDSVCGRWTNGAAWADVDGDGRLDLYLTRQGEPEQLFMGRPGGRFADDAAARGVDGGGGLAIGASFADYDNDGDADLYVVNDGPNLLYRNDGTGRFTDVGAAAGVADEHVGASASWGDYDGDGFLDLYVTNHSRCVGLSVGQGIILQPDRLYRNNGDGTFSDETALLEGDPSTPEDGSTLGAGFQAAWFDYDHDGRQDLHLGNDFLTPVSDRNHLWRNEGRGPDGRWRFTDVSVKTRTSFAMNTMGIAVGDFDRDLRFDLALSNVEPNRLLRNVGRNGFTDVGRKAGVDRPFQRATKRSVTWGLEFADLNLDGWEDLYIAAGYLADYLGDPETPQRNEVFVNRGDGTFADLSAPSGADDPGQSRGVALADYDRDGRLDVYVVNQGGVPRLYRNVTPLRGRHWIEVDTVGTVSNRDGCGARFVLTVRRRSMLRQVSCGSTSVSSSSDQTVHFGLGRARVASRLVIEWPSGARQVLRDVRADRRITVTEPGR